VLVTEILPRALELAPEAPAVVCDGLRLSYRELGQRVARLAAALRGLGLRRGDQVALLHPNCHRALETYLAAADCGVVLVPCHVRLTARDLALILDDTESRVLILDGSLTDLGCAAVAASRGAPLVVRCGGRCAALDTLVADWVYFAGGTTNSRHCPQ
jgi:long-chain acyl-CoA synthetase